MELGWAFEGETAVDVGDEEFADQVEELLRKLEQKDGEAPAVTAEPHALCKV